MFPQEGYHIETGDTLEIKQQSPKFYECRENF